MSEKRVLFVRSGGGFPGLDLHAGMWRALAAMGIESTENIGTSAGAIVGAFDSAGIEANRFESIMLSLDDRSVRDERIGWKARVFWIDWFLSHSPIRGLLEDELDVMTFGQLQKPLAVVSTRVTDGTMAIFRETFSDDTTSLIDCILASMSIHGVFPAVEIDGEPHADGGVSENLYLPPNWREYDEVWLLIASPATEYGQRKNMISRGMMNVSWLMQRQITRVLEQVRGAKNVHVIWPPFGRAHGSLRFDHRLIDQAFTWTLRKIDEINERKSREASV